MNLCIYGTKSDQQIVFELIQSIPEYTYRKILYTMSSDYDDFLCKLERSCYDIIFVISQNASGMEGVIAARKIRPNVPVVWCSDDYNFGAQSYRLGCAYFTGKPLTKEIIATALQYTRPAQTL